MWVTNSFKTEFEPNTESRIDCSDYSMCVWALEYDMSISCKHACLWKYINCKEFTFLLILNC